MAKLAINILIEKRKKLEKDSKVYSIVSFLFHALVISILFLNASYSRYKEVEKPKVYKVAIATLPSLSTTKKGGSIKESVKKVKPQKAKEKIKKKKKENDVKGINPSIKTKRVEKKQEKAATSRKTKKGKGNTTQSNEIKRGFSDASSSIMDLDTTSFDYAYYLAIVRDKIGNNWIRTYTGIGKVKIYFKIMRNGEIRDAKIEISSGNTGLDRLALEAVLKSNPLPPLPEGFRGDYIGIHIWFNYEE